MARWGADRGQFSKASYAPGEPIVLKYDVSGTMALGYRLHWQVEYGQNGHIVNVGPPIPIDKPKGTAIFRLTQDALVPPGAKGAVACFQSPYESEHLGHYFEVVAREGWKDLGGNFRQLAHGAHGAYGIDAVTGRVLSYDGSQWIDLGRAMDAITGNNMSLYGLLQQGLYQYDDRNSTWNAVLQNVLYAAGSGTAIVAVDNALNIQYKGNPATPSWTRVGKLTGTIRLNNRRLFQISPDFTEVYSCLPIDGKQDPPWTKIGSSPDLFGEIVAADNAVYALISKTGRLSRWQGQTTWVDVGKRATNLTADGVWLVGKSVDDGRVWAFRGQPGEWQQICGPADQILMGHDSMLLGLKGGRALYYALPSATQYASAASAARDSTDSSMVLSASNVGVLQ